MTRGATIVIAGTLLTLGLLGITPAVHEPYPGDAPRLQVRNAIGMIFGVVPNNLPLALLHLVSGLSGLASVIRPGWVMTYLRGISVCYGLLAILGMIPTTNTLFGTTPLYGFNLWIHLLVAVVALLTGWLLAAGEFEDQERFAGPTGGGQSLASRAAIGGRPVHPLLVPFPIAFLAGALAADLAYWWTTLPWYNGYMTFWSRASLWLLAAGLTMATIAALIGSIDFFTIQRVRSLRTGRLHALGGLTIIGLAAVNLSLRFGDPALRILPLGITLSILTVIVLVATAWEGNTLVYRHRVAVRDDRGTLADTDEVEIDRLIGNTDDAGTEHVVIPAVEDGALESGAPHPPVIPERDGATNTI